MHISASLDPYSTVFQAEVHAIELCIRENIRRRYRNHIIYILSDSRAALFALKSQTINSKLVWDCLQQLLLLANTNRVTLIWVPGHRGIVGNEAADLLARKGAKQKFINPLPFCGIPLASAKLAIKDWMYTQMQIYWDNTQGNRFAKKLLSNHSPQRSNQILGMNREKVRTLTGILTGHCNLKKHLHLIGISPDDLCRMCHEDEESMEHVLCHCEGLARTRLHHLGSGFINLTQLTEISLKSLLQFYCSTGLGREIS